MSIGQFEYEGCVCAIKAPIRIASLCRVTRLTFCIVFINICMKRAFVYSGYYYRKFTNNQRVHAGREPNFWPDLVAGLLRNEIFCISKIYSNYFYIDDSLEFVSVMIEKLEYGMGADFWLSFYQAADLCDKLKNNDHPVAKGFLGKHSTDSLLDSAINTFGKKRVPSHISEVALQDIISKRRKCVPED